MCIFLPIETAVKIKEFSSVYDDLKRGAIHRWKQLGQQLDLESYVLEEISADYKDNPEENMQKVFDLWKEQLCKPVWKNLISAIEQTDVNLQLSQSLRKDYQEGQLLLYYLSMSTCLY